MRHHIRKNPLAVPHTGNIRDDLIKLLWATAERGVPRAVDWTLQISGIYAATGVSPAHLREDLFSGVQNSLSTVLLRGVARGEIEGSKLTPRIMSLPNDLLRNEVMLTLEPVPMKVIAEIVDEVFLPLVLPSRTSKQKRSAAKTSEMLTT